MMVLITYDVQTVDTDGKRRLRRVARQCLNYGQRVQNSVFECVLDSAQFAELKFRISAIIDKEKDSVRFYFLGNKWELKVESIGAETSFNVDGDLIV